MPRVLCYLLFVIISFLISSNSLCNAKQKPKNEWYSVSGIVYESIGSNGRNKFTCGKLLNAKFLGISEPKVNDLESCLNKCSRSYSIFVHRSTETIIDKFQGCCLPRCECSCLLEYGVKESKKKSKYENYKTCKLTEYAVENCLIKPEMQLPVEIIQFKPSKPLPPHRSSKIPKRAAKDKSSEEIDEIEQNLNNEQETDFQEEEQFFNPESGLLIK